MIAADIPIETFPASEGSISNFLIRSSVIYCITLVYFKLAISVSSFIFSIFLTLLSIRYKIYTFLPIIIIIRSLSTNIVLYTINRYYKYIYRIVDTNLLIVI